MGNSTPSALQAINELEDKFSNTILGLLITTALMSYWGARVIVSGTGWEKEAMAIALAIAVFFIIKLLFNSQRTVFSALKNKSTGAIAVLVLAISLILLISGSTNVIGLIHHNTALLSMQDGQKNAEELGSQGKRSHHATTSLSALLMNYKDKAEGLSRRAISGELTGSAGFGPVAKRYATSADELSGLVNMVEERMSKGEPLMYAMDAASSRMGAIIEQDISLGDKVQVFEVAHRDYANHYNRLVGLKIADQIRAGLNSLTGTAIAENTSNRVSRKALYSAEDFSQKIASDINNYLEANLEPLPVMRAYKQPSPSVSTFRHASSFIPQVALGFGADLALILLLILRIIAVLDSEYAPTDNPRIALKDLDLLASSMNRILEVRKEARDEALEDRS